LNSPARISTPHFYFKAIRKFKYSQALKDVFEPQSTQQSLRDCAKETHKKTYNAHDVRTCHFVQARSAHFNRPLRLKNRSFILEDRPSGLSY
jgi:hypothetical protein